MQPLNPAQQLQRDRQQMFQQFRLTHFEMWVEQKLRPILAVSLGDILSNARKFSERTTPAEREAEMYRLVPILDNAPPYLQHQTQRIDLPLLDPGEFAAPVLKILFRRMERGWLQHDLSKHGWQAQDAAPLLMSRVATNYCFNVISAAFPPEVCDCQDCAVAIRKYMDEFPSLYRGTMSRELLAMSAQAKQAQPQIRPAGNGLLVIENGEARPL